MEKLNTECKCYESTAKMLKDAQSQSIDDFDISWNNITNKIHLGLRLEMLQTIL